MYQISEASATHLWRQPPARQELDGHARIERLACLLVEKLARHACQEAALFSTNFVGHGCHD